MPNHNMPFVSRLIDERMHPAMKTRYLDDALYHHDIEVTRIVLCAVANALSVRGVSFDVGELVLGDAARELLPDPRLGAEQ